MPQTLVCLHAHPDDETIVTGGTIARAAAAGHRVVLVLATLGELGETPGLPNGLKQGTTLGEVRKVEAERAAEILGIARIAYLGYHDSGMAGEATNARTDCFAAANIDNAAAQLAQILLEEDAYALTIYDEHGGYGHPDHIQVHRVGVQAAELAGTPRVYEATMNRDHLLALMRAQMDEDGNVGGIGNVEDFDMGSAASAITTTVDVGDFVDAKRSAMAAHASQISDDSFFLQIPVDAFRDAFGWEWFIRRGPRPDEHEDWIF
ncbi:MAG: GlcNAc-PI de-N-acetylase [Acidimicrobiia bacterium]|nr:GlcNAc-PI de-N-acetylase [Acidimicrobiia bacterium]